jgi:hypothetical protein
MTWLLLRIVDLFNAVAAWYYQRRFGTAARHLGRSPQEEDGRRGFIIIEIDGLAYDFLRQAMKEGYMPYLARLILRRRLRLARWRCGLPSTTPASQAGILYGNNWDIPGFRWYRKESQQSITFKLPGSARTIQERIAAGRAGLLRGGSSYTNVFDGDARLALFTLAALGRDRLFENVRGMGFLVLFGLGPVRVLKVIGLSLWTWLVYVVKRLASWLRVRSSDPHFTFFGPLWEIVTNIIFREVTTFSVMLDIYRGMPAVYASYTGYDEIAHHFGANSREAFRALRGLDKQIRQIDRMREIYRQREFDLYILSDHGMTPSISFRRAFGQTLQEFIASHTGQTVHAGDSDGGSEGFPETRAQFLLDEIRGLEAGARGALSARLLRAARQQLEEQFQVEAFAAEWDLSRRDDITVQNSGSLSHIYLNVTARPMDLSEVALLYPALLSSLVDHEGIGLVVGREGKEVVIAGKSGSLWVGPAGRRLEGANPLMDNLPDPDWVVAQIARVARFPHAGDLILIGDWDGKHVVTFEDQVATHGGLGGPQDWPFLAFSTEERLAPRGIENSEELYIRLVRLYGDYD